MSAPPSLPTPPHAPDTDGPDVDSAIWCLDSVEAIQRAMTAVAAEMALALAAATRGEAVDLAGLDGSVAEICAAAVRLSPPAGSTLLGPLLDLAAGLEQLSTALRQAESTRKTQEETAEQASRRSRAADAYRRSRTLPPEPADRDVPSFPPAKS